MKKVVFLSLLASLFAAGVAHASECTVEARPGIEEADRDAVDEVLCSQLRTEAPGTHRVRVAKLGTKIIVTVLSQNVSGPTERQVILQNIDELSVAAPRLASAVAEQKPLGETLQVNNVLGEDARIPKKKPAEVHAWLTLLGAGMPGVGVGPGAGLALSGGNDRWSFVGEGRVAGLDTASDAKPTMLLQLSGGVRHHFLSRDISPFVGVGASVLYLAEADRSRSRVVINGAEQTNDDSKAGLAGGLEAGVDILRTSTVGGALILRADLPAFAAAGVAAGTPIFSGGLAMRF